jgi:HK97 family phage portal protein
VDGDLKMLEKFRKGKNDKDTNTKATDRQAYLNASVPAWEKFSTGIQRNRGYTALMQRFHGWVYAAAMINARGVASQPIKLYSMQPRNGMKSIVNTKKVGSQKASYLRGEMESKPSIFVQRKMMTGCDVVEVHEHPVLELLDNPSPEMDGYTLTMQRMLNLQLTGNAYLHPIISETIGVPLELWNMQSDLVTVVPDGTMDLVKSYTYGRRPNMVDFRKDEVLHEKQPNPSDPFYGFGWVAAAIDAVDLLNSMDEYEQNVLDNQARPDWAIMVKEHLTDTQYQRLMQQVERQLGGKNNRSRPFIFEGGTDGKPMQFSPQDLAFDSGETRKIEVIAAIAGVPVTKLKANDPNLANAREGNLGWLRDTIVPYLTLDESFLNRQLLPMFGMFADTLFLAYDDPVSADRSQQATIDASDIAAGIRTRNEVRAERGLEPISEGGDELFVPMGSVPIDVAIENARNPQPMFGTYSTAPKAEVEADEPVPEAVELTEAELEGQPQQVESSSALNGAQVTAALEIVNLVAQGQMPRASAIGQLMTFFNLTEEQAENIMGDVGRGFVPELTIETESKAPVPVDGKCPDGWHYMAETNTCMEGASHPATYSVEKASDCMSEKISILLDEGYPQDQAVAIAHSLCNKTKVEEKSHDCDCKKKHDSTKEMWDESRSLISQKRAPIDSGNEEFLETMELFSSPMDGFRDDLVKLFRKEIERFLDMADGMGEFMTSAEAEQKIRELTDKFVDDVMLLSGQNELDRLGVDLQFNQLDPIIANTLQNYKDQLTDTLIFGTGKEIADKVDLGMRHGASTDEIARDIRSLLEEEPDTGRIPIEARAEMIARTEVALINEIGRLDAWNQSGVVAGKQWVVAAGACESCQAMGKKNDKPIGINESFANRGERIGKVNVWTPTGGGLQTPPLHPNCRCTMVEILDDEDLKTRYEL